MKNKNNERKFISCYEDECGIIKDKNFDLDFEFDIDEEDEYCTNELKNAHNKDCEEVYQEGYKDGYEKSLLEIVCYMKKNKCCIKCKPKCKHSCKLRGRNKNTVFHKMV